MPVGQLGLQLDMVAGGARDVARAAGARASLVDGGVHGLGDNRVLTLAEIVVRAPDHDVAFAVRTHPGRTRKSAATALEIGEHPVTPLGPDLLHRGPDGGLVIHAAHDPRWAKGPATNSGRLFAQGVRLVHMVNPTAERHITD